MSPTSKQRPRPPANQQAQATKLAADAIRNAHHEGFVGGIEAARGAVKLYASALPEGFTRAGIPLTDERARAVIESTQRCMDIITDFEGSMRESLNVPRETVSRG